MLPLVIVLGLTAPSAPQKWVALVHLTGDAPASWKQPLQEAAEQNKQSAQWAPPPAVTLDEAQLALGCAGWSKSCAGQIAGMTGAAVAFVVEVTPKDAGIVVGVQTVKASGAPLGAEEKMELPGRGDKDLELARDFVRGAGKSVKTGVLVVETDVANAEIVVDEKRVKGRFEEMLPVGEHHVTITADGKAPLSKTVVVKAGQVTPEILSLSAAGPPVETTPTVGVDTHPHEVTTTPEQPPVPAPAAPADNGVVGWGLAGSGGAIAVVGGVFAAASIYDRFYNRVTCGPQNQSCVPNVPLLFGIYPAKGDGRARFESDSGAWIGGSVAAVGVGALLLGTGVVLATGDEPPATTSTGTSTP